jgi:hypothetical protein
VINIKNFGIWEMIEVGILVFIWLISLFEKTILGSSLILNFDPYNQEFYFLDDSNSISEFNLKILLDDVPNIVSLAILYFI